MNSSPSIEHQVALKLIFGDMAFARRYIDGIISHANERQTYVLSFGMMRYLSLYIHEAQKATEVVAPELASMLAVENADIIERSRNTLKLFDDTHNLLGGAIGVTGQLDTISGVQQEYFLDNTWLPPAKILVLQPQIVMLSAGSVLVGNKTVLTRTRTGTAATGMLQVCWD
jgi:hypothetical protein